MLFIEMADIIKLRLWLKRLRKKLANRLSIVEEQFRKIQLPDFNIPADLEYFEKFLTAGLGVPKDFFGKSILGIARHHIISLRIMERQMYKQLANNFPH